MPTVVEFVIVFVNFARKKKFVYEKAILSFLTRRFFFTQNRVVLNPKVRLGQPGIAHIWWALLYINRSTIGLLHALAH